jgi:crotonobetainyl-CoA:carnitine CoA-transferase CaiB-like acyl-CoA transferase
MPLEGYRILDLSIWLTGAGATGQLADLGADVIKIESPTRPDPARNAPSPVLLELCNRNKRAITLNLKSSEGRRIFYRMVESADVVAQNLRPGVAARLGVEHATLLKHNPGIILASFSGFGSKGPEAEGGAFDMIGQARSGLMDVLSDHRPPSDVRYIGPIGLADQNGAMTFAFGILAALASRAIDGVGQHVEVSHLSALMTLQTLPLHTYLMEGGELPRPPDRTKEKEPLGNIYEAGDGRWIAISVALADADKYWPDFCDAVERSDLKTDPRYSKGPARSKNSESLIAILDRQFATRTSDEWMQRLRARHLIVSKVQDYRDLITDPQVEANAYLQTVEHPTLGQKRVLSPPVAFSATKPSYRSAAPSLGQHTDEILQEHGFSPQEVERFRADGVV